MNARLEALHRNREAVLGRITEKAEAKRREAAGREAVARLADEMAAKVEALKAGGLHAVRVPAKHGLDWFDRYTNAGGAPGFAGVAKSNARFAYLELDGAALRDLVDDAAYYEAEMDGREVLEVDMRAPAGRVLEALARAGYSDLVAKARARWKRD